MDVKDIVITEGVESTWYYHFSHKDSTVKSLCGKPTMQTNLSKDQWGFVSPHIGERYCKDCERLIKE